MIKRILRFPYHAVRNITVNAIIGQKTRKRVYKSYIPDSNIWLAVDQASITVLNFLENRRHSPGNFFEYRYSAKATVPTLYASAYACMVLSLLGKLEQLSEAERLAWLSYFDSFQNQKDGLFYDPAAQNEIYANTDWWGARHLALHMISAYTALKGRPKYPFRFVEHYYKPEHISKWLNKFDWSCSVGQTEDIDNKIMNIGCLLQYQRDMRQDQQAAVAVAYLQGYLKKRINPITGMWGTCNINNPHERSRIVQFAYHLYPLFFYDNLQLDYADQIVDLVLKTQNSVGGFGVKFNSSACEDIDSIDILCRFASLVPERKPDIDTALRKALKWVLCNQVNDYGFVFRLYEPLTYGHKEMSSGINEGAMFPTWFRLLSLIYLSRYFGQQMKFNINLCPGYEF